jgi:predicted transcriptional regulator of viral defense system
MDKSSLKTHVSSWRGFRLESLLRIHTISEEVKIERNTTTLLKAAGDHASTLGVFRARDMVMAGYSREYLRRLVTQEKVRQLGRGLYVAAGFDGDQNQSLVQAAKRMPRAVVCLISALQFHGIGTQSPHQVWLALPRGSNRPRGTDLPLRFCQFSGRAYTFGIEEHALSGGTVRVYSPAKTVADCFKYRQKYGLDVAVEALREGWRGKKFSMKALAAAADVCRVSRVMQPYLEMLT